MHLVSQGPTDTHAIAAKLAHRLLQQMPQKTIATVVALHGELGAGKTTFVQGFAKALGIIEQPKSPTFNLAKTYRIPSTPYTLWHLDCYRLQGRQDIATLDLHTAFADPMNLILVEWPERIGDGLPRDRVDVRFEHVDPERRAITIPE